MPPDPRRHFHLWTTLVLLLLPALALLAWSGASSDPRQAIPWNWTKTGWIVPTPSLATLWIASTILLIILSAIAWLLFYPIPGATTLNPWASASLIFVLATAARIAIATTWIPLPLDPVILSAQSLPSSAPFHALAILADLITIALVLLALHRANRSLWWAALYAFHPLTLIEIAGNAHWISFALPVLVLLIALSHHLPRWIHLAISGLAALSAVCLVAATAHHPPFNSLVCDILSSITISNRAILPALQALLQAIILLIAIRRNWPLPRTLAHIFIMFLLCSPIVDPWNVLPLLALLPLAWSRAGWLLSILVLAAYAAVILLEQRKSPQLPSWLLMLEWMPIFVLEAQELLAETLTPTSTSALPTSAPSAAPVTVVP